MKGQHIVSLNINSGEPNQVRSKSSVHNNIMAQTWTSQKSAAGASSIDVTQSADKHTLKLEQLRQSRKLIENDINRMTTRIINLESKNDKDLHQILEERKKTEQLIQKRYETFYIKEQIRLNKEKDLVEKRQKIQARN